MKPSIKRADLVVRQHHPFQLEPIVGKGAEETQSRGCSLIKDHYYWITSGNLLGIYRDGKLIDHDTDIDVCILWDFFTDNYQKTVDLVTKMAKGGFIPILSVIYEDKPMQLAFMDATNKVIFDIYFYYSGFGDKVLNWNMEGTIEKPYGFIDTLGSIEFRGETYPTPHPIEKFLVWRFGKDWKTPAKKKVAWQEEAKHLTRW